MRHVHELTREQAAALRALFCDIDDTLTLQGRLPAEAYAALWRLADAGLAVVPVTGRPAGWADPIARLWPVAGIVAENGAVAFWLRDGQMCRSYARPPKDMRADQARLLEAAFRIVRDVGGCRLAADQPFRISDVAIDFAEEVPPLDLEAALVIRHRFEELGARAKISSIHVNAWFGDFDKASTCRRFAAEQLAIDIASTAAAYVGDSPNDEPLFEAFPLSFGVANLARFLHLLAHRPAYLARAEGGTGFAEIADRILTLRAPAPHPVPELPTAPVPPRDGTPPKPAPRKPAPPKASPRKPAPRKAVPRKPAPPKASPRKPAPRKAVPRKPVPPKASPRKPASRTSPLRKPAPASRRPGSAR